MESPRERCEEPDCMCSEICTVWTSKWAQTPINVVSSPLRPDILVSSFLTQIPFTLSHFFPPCSNKKSECIIIFFGKCFPLILSVLKKCSFLLGRIFLLSYFSCFLRVLSPFFFAFVSKTIPETSACFKYLFSFLDIFTIFFLHVCPFSVPLTKKSFLLCFFLSVFWTFSFFVLFLEYVFPWFLFLVVLFWMYLFFWRFSLIWLSFFCPFFIFSFYILSCNLKKNTFFSTTSIFVFFFWERERNGVFLLQFNIFTFFNVCFASLFTPFVRPLSTCSFFLSLRVFRFFRHFNLLFFLLLDCLFVFLRL